MNSVINNELKRNNKSKNNSNNNNNNQEKEKGNHLMEDGAAGPKHCQSACVESIPFCGCVSASPPRRSLPPAVRERSVRGWRSYRAHRTGDQSSCRWCGSIVRWSIAPHPEPADGAAKGTSARAPCPCHL